MLQLLSTLLSPHTLGFQASHTALGRPKFSRTAQQLAVDSALLKLGALTLRGWVAITFSCRSQQATIASLQMAQQLLWTTILTAHRLAVQHQEQVRMRLVLCCPRQMLR